MGKVIPIDSWVTPVIRGRAIYYRGRCHGLTFRSARELAETVFMATVYAPIVRMCCGIKVTSFLEHNGESTAIFLELQGKRVELDRDKAMRLVLDLEKVAS